MVKNYNGNTEIEKTFIKTFKDLCFRKNPWSVWCHFIDMFACSISNAVDYDDARWKNREDSYLSIINSYTEEEQNLFAKLTALTIQALEENPEQDFLGSLYMNLDFGSDWHGQFFTPWDVAEVMARTQIRSSLYDSLEQNGFITVNDPACGSGCMLMAFAHICRLDEHIGNYQPKVLFVGQDVDRIVAQMCYIQLSLLGCSGYIVIGDTLIHPTCGNPLFPRIHPNNEIWFTPMWFSNLWSGRRIWRQIDNLFGN